MKLSKEEIRHIADLARIQLSENEEEKYAAELSSVLDYIDILQGVDVENIAPTAQVTGLENVTREDIVIECDAKTREKIIEQFPERTGNLLKVRAIFKESI